MERPLLRQPAFAILLTLIFAAPAMGEDPHASDKRTRRLLLQLGDDVFSIREAAGEKLASMGESVLPELRKAAVSYADSEVRWRAQRIIRLVILQARKSKSIGLEMVVVESASFQMGSPASEENRRPDETEHRVHISKPFLMGSYEVTQNEYEKVMKNNPSWFSSTGSGKDKVEDWDTGRFPVENITWYDAIDFCNRLSQLDGYPRYYQVADEIRTGSTLRNARVFIAGGNGYRLPTEAEWELACRGGTFGPFHLSGQRSRQEANFKPGPPTGYGSVAKWQSLGRTTRVGSFPPNAFGLYDMHGNVGEWCWDWYDEKYYVNSPVDDPQGPQSGNHRLQRGGSWLVNEGSCRSASRFWGSPKEETYYSGFRVCRTP